MPWPSHHHTVCIDPKTHPNFRMSARTFREGHPAQTHPTSSCCALHLHLLGTRESNLFLVVFHRMKTLDAMVGMAELRGMMGSMKSPKVRTPRVWGVTSREQAPVLLMVVSCAGLEGCTHRNHLVWIDGINRLFTEILRNRFFNDRESASFRQQNNPIDLSRRQPGLCQGVITDHKGSLNQRHTQLTRHGRFKPASHPQGATRIVPGQNRIFVVASLFSVNSRFSFSAAWCSRTRA